MTVCSLGKIAPVTPGTPVQITTDDTLRAASVTVAQIGGTTGRVLFGLAGQLNKTSLAGAVRTFLPPATAGFLDTHCVDSGNSANSIQLSKFCVDADTAGEGLLVSYTVE